MLHSAPTFFTISSDNFHVIDHLAGIEVGHIGLATTGIAGPRRPHTWPAPWL